MPLLTPASSMATRPRQVAFYVGALALTSMFWLSGIAKLWDWPEALREMTHFGLLPAWLFAAGTIFVQFAGSALLVFGGRFAWLGAAALGLFTLASIPIAHAFWTLPPGRAFGERLIAEEHVSVISGLFIAALLARDAQSANDAA